MINRKSGAAGAVAERRAAIVVRGVFVMINYVCRRLAFVHNTLIATRDGGHAENEECKYEGHQFHRQQNYGVFFEYFLYSAKLNLMSLVFISMPGSVEWLIILVGLLFLYYWVRAIYSISTSRFESPSMKIFWLAVVIFLGVVGAFIYDIAGRRTRIV